MIKRATPEQSLECQKLTHTVWGGALSIDQYHDRESVLSCVPSYEREDWILEGFSF